MLADGSLYKELSFFLSLLTCDLTFLCSSGHACWHLRRSSNDCSWREKWESESPFTFTSETIVNSWLYPVKKVTGLSAESHAGLLSHWRMQSKDRLVQPRWTVLVNTEGDECTLWSSVFLWRKGARAGLCSLGLREIQRRELRSLMVENWLHQVARLWTVRVQVDLGKKNKKKQAKVYRNLYWQEQQITCVSLNVLLDFDTCPHISGHLGRLDF